MRTRQWLRAIPYVSYPYAVVGEIAIDFYPIVFKGHLILGCIRIKVKGEFGIKAIRYANYRYAEVGESAIRFLSNRVQKNIVSYPKFT